MPLMLHNCRQLLSYKMIAHLAYLRAEKRGFAPGHEVEDWLQAESEVDQMLHGG